MIRKLTDPGRGLALLLALLLGASCDDMTSAPGSGPPPRQTVGCRPAPPIDGMPIRINEVMVRNETTLADGLGRFSPWVELYNPTEEPFDLGGVPLSDDLLDADKWTIPCIPEAVIPAEGFLIIFLDGEDGPGRLHTSFRPVPGAGLQLTLNGGSNVFIFDDTEIAADISASRFPDGEGRISEAQPTPGAPNDPPLPPRQAPFVRGDGNGDGRITVSDAAYILRVAFGEEAAPPCADRLDADDDGRIAQADGLYLQELLFSGGAPPPPPYPEAGSDPTADDLQCRE